MYSDIRAGSTGDMLTIVLAERTAAQRESGWENQANTSASGAGNLSGGGSINGRFGLDASFSKDASTRNESVQSDLLRGTMTAVVRDRDATGNLMIEGERRLNVNGETHVMKISGLVRPADVQPNNTVLSYQIAGASIEYRREGGIKRSVMKPGRVARFGGIALIAAAFLIGS